MLQGGLCLLRQGQGQAERVSRRGDAFVSVSIIVIAINATLMTSGKDDCSTDAMIDLVAGSPKDPRAIAHGQAYPALSR